MNFSFIKFYVYFIISYFALSLIGREFQYLYEYIDVLVSVVLMISLVAYVNKLIIFVPLFWKLYVPICFLWDVYTRFLSFPLFEGTPKEYIIWEAFEIIVFLIPMYLMAIKYAYFSLPKLLR